MLEVEINGEVPSEGIVAISNGQVAYAEGLKIGNTKISSSAEGLIESENRVVCQAVTEKTRLKDKHYAFDTIDSNYNTVLKTDLSYIGNIPKGKYEPGDEYLCEVKPGTTYRFYVLSTDGDNVNLIMDQNITSKGTPVTLTNNGTVEWISDEDYGCGTNGTNCADNDKGPITAVNFLKNAVLDWINIPEKAMNYTARRVDGYVYDSTTPDPIYNDSAFYSFQITTRARMIYHEEAYNVGCLDEVNTTVDGVVKKLFYDTCPLWLTNNLQFKRDASKGEAIPEGATVIVNGPRGYWTNNYTNSNPTAFEILDHGNVNSKEVYRNDYNGVRPVITLDKKNIK